MTELVDFLPESFRARQQRLRKNRGRPVMVLCVVVAIMATDLVFRHRIHRLGTMLDERQTQVEQRQAQIALLDREVEAGHQRLEHWTEPFGNAGLSAILDELLTDRPQTVRFHELFCQLEPWAANPVSALRLEASADDLEGISAYLDALRERRQLPQLVFRQTIVREQDGRHEFRLENAAGAVR